MRIINQHRNHGNQPDCREKQRKNAEKRQRLILANHRENRVQYLEPVAERVQLAVRSLRSVSILHGHFIQLKILIQAVNGHLGFDLKPLGEHGIRLGERKRKRAISGHNVGYVRAEQSVDAAAHKLVSEIMHWTLVFLEIR